MAERQIEYNLKDKDLLNNFIVNILPESIEKLDENDEPLWGKMTPQHMIEHLVLTFKSSTGQIESSCLTPEDKIPETQAFLETNKELPRGILNPVSGDELHDLHFPNFQAAKDKLLNEIDIFIEYYEENPDAKQVNPRFCTLDKDQWYKFHFKHCFHHLKQFGLVEVKS